MIHQIDKCRYGNPQIAQGAFGSISIAILHHRKENEPQQFSFVAIKTIRNALDSSSFSHQHGSCDNNNNNNNNNQIQKDQNRSRLSLPVFTELAALRVLSCPNYKHENITPLLSIITSAHDQSSFLFDHEISLVFPYCPMDLHQIIQSHRFHKDSQHVHLEFSVIRTVLRDILRGLEHIHSLGIVHGDMKPGNILLDSRGIFQLADFGLAQLMSTAVVDHDAFASSNHHTHTHPHPPPAPQGLCTLPYRPPEILFGSMRHLYKSSVDMWGVGLIACEMLSGRALFYGVSVLDQLSKIINVLGTPTKDSWEGLEDLTDYKKVIFDPQPGLGLGMVVNPISEDDLLESLVSGLVVMDPAKRKSAMECLNHEWMMGKSSTGGGAGGGGGGICSPRDIVEKLIPSQFISCYNGMKVDDFTDEMKDYLLEQMKLSGAEIALQRRKYHSGPNNKDCLDCDDDNNDDSSPLSLKVSKSLPSSFSSKLKAFCLEGKE